MPKETKPQDEIIAALLMLSTRFPQQRFMQIIFNALDAQGLARYADGHPRDTFYVSDDALASALLAYMDHTKL